MQSVQSSTVMMDCCIPVSVLSIGSICVLSAATSCSSGVWSTGFSVAHPMPRTCYRPVFGLRSVPLAVCGVILKLIFITSGKEIMFSSLFVCLSLSEPICMIFSGKVGSGPLNEWLNFGGDLGHRWDTGIVSGFVTIGS